LRSSPTRGVGGERKECGPNLFVKTKGKVSERKKNSAEEMTVHARDGKKTLAGEEGRIEQGKAAQEGVQPIPYKREGTNLRKRDVIGEDTKKLRRFGSQKGKKAGLKKSREKKRSAPFIRVLILPSGKEKHRGRKRGNTTLGSTRISP